MGVDDYIETTFERLKFMREIKAFFKSKIIKNIFYRSNNYYAYFLYFIYPTEHIRLLQ